MEQKICNACGRSFTPRPQTPHQTYCPRPECQRKRRRRWQQQKRQGDSDYRDNDLRNSKDWASENPPYWKQYRDENPDSNTDVLFFARDGACPFFCVNRTLFVLTIAVSFGRNAAYCR